MLLTALCVLWLARVVAPRLPWVWGASVGFFAFLPVVAKTGAMPISQTVASSGYGLSNVTNGAWYLDCLITCHVLGQAATDSKLNAFGTLDIGPANNAATFPVNVGVMIGTPQTDILFNMAQAYYIELHNTWSATTGAPTITCTQLNVYGCN